MKGSKHLSNGFLIKLSVLEAIWALFHEGPKAWEFQYVTLYNLAFDDLEDFPLVIYVRLPVQSFLSRYPQRDLEQWGSLTWLQDPC